MSKRSIPGERSRYDGRETRERSVRSVIPFDGPGAQSAHSPLGERSRSRRRRLPFAHYKSSSAQASLRAFVRLPSRYVYPPGFSRPHASSVPASLYHLPGKNNPDAHFIVTLVPSPHQCISLSLPHRKFAGVKLVPDNVVMMHRRTDNDSRSPTDQISFWISLPRTSSTGFHSTACLVRVLLRADITL